MYHRYYGEPELARETFAGLPEAVRQRLTAVDYSRAEAGLPAKAGHRPAYAPGRGDVGLEGGGKAGTCRKSPARPRPESPDGRCENKLFWPVDHRRLPDPDKKSQGSDHLEPWPKPGGAVKKPPWLR